MRKITPLAWAVLIALLLVNAVILFQLTSTENEKLTVSFLDIGQGDSILIESPTGVQMLVDGGPDRSVVRELSKQIGPLDRSIDIVVATHPDKDHIAGLTDVFALYKVGTYIESGIAGSSSYSASLAASAENEVGSEHIVARRGMRIHLGGGAYADILYPDRDVSHQETNAGSIVMRVVYGETEVMLSGDAPIAVEDWVATLSENASIQSDILKAGHHGSRTSTSDFWLHKINPTLVVVSAGKGNSYGHPHEEVVTRIHTFGSQLLTTAELGTLTFTSDGHMFVRQ